MCVGLSGSNFGASSEGEASAPVWLEQARLYHRQTNLNEVPDLSEHSNSGRSAKMRGNISGVNADGCLFAAYLSSEFFGVDIRRLLSSERDDAQVSCARQIAAYIAHTSLGISYTSISKVFERDRTTIAHACRTIEDRRDDVYFDAQLSKLEGFVSVLMKIAADRLGNLSQSEISQLIQVAK